MTVAVVTAEQAADRDASTIEAGTPSISLMRRAGRSATRALLARFADLARKGVCVFVGPGNNGGDGWVVAEALADAEIPVRVIEVVAARTRDAKSVSSAVRAHLATVPTFEDPAVVVDAMLGTGASGPLRSPIGEAAATISALRANGAKVVALDLPTGLDATSGGVAAGGVVADLTLSFGTIKRGQLVARSQCGEIIVLDIGLGLHAHRDDGAPTMLDATHVRALIPPIGAESHKGTRKKLLVVGGARGMAGAVVLASRAALRSGIGMVRACVAHESIQPVQSTVVEATAIPWPTSDAETHAALAWPDVLLIGPGLGAGARAVVEQWLHATTIPVVLDADALNAFAGDAAALGALLAGRRAIVTPHVAEFGRLTSRPPAQVLEERWDAGLALAQTIGCCVLLKGVPTIISGSDGRCVVSATGTPALATAGSGDVLSGIVATLLAQMDDAVDAAACGAWAHGRAAELASEGHALRGVTLDDVVHALPLAWRRPTPLEDGVLATLPRIGDDDA